MGLIYKKDVIENSACVLMNRVRLATGAYVTQSNIGAIKARVVDTQDGTQVLSDITIDPTVAVSNALVTGDLRFDADATGYNFVYTLDGTYLPKGGRTYQVDVRFTPSSGPTVIVIWQLKTVNTYIEDATEEDA